MSGEPEPIKLGGVTFTRVAGLWQAGAEGWARTTTNLEHDMLEEIAELRARVAELEGAAPPTPGTIVAIDETMWRAGNV